MPVDNRQARIENLMNGTTGNNVAVCECCGSTHFYAVTVEQFSKGFKSVEYTSVSTNPKSVKICLCGTPLPSNTGAKGANAVRALQEGFQNSLVAARKHLSTNSVKELVKNASSPKELEDVKTELLSQIESLRAEVTALKAKDKPKDK